MLPQPATDRAGRSTDRPGGQRAFSQTCGAGRGHGESIMNSMSMYRESRTIYATATLSESLYASGLTLNLNSG